MALLSLNAVRKSFGTRTVLDGLDFAIEPQARVGIVGANGSGKSTLLRLLAGLEEPDAGTAVRRRGLTVSYLPQHPLGDARTPIETVLAARPDLAELDGELNRVSDQLGTPALAADLEKMARVLGRQEELLERWEALGGPSIEGRARATLLDVGIEEADLALPTTALSGGQRKLIALAACLAQDPEVLLLDEPEAHLDAVGRSLLERLLGGFHGAAVVVSHDRYLLDETVSQIASLDRGRIRMWPGNYSAYTLARELELQRQQQQFVTQQKEIERLEEAIRRFKLWASWVPDQRHIRQARNKQRQIDSMEKVERPVLERRKIALRLHPHQRGGQRVFELRHVGVQFGEDVVLADLELTVMHGERVGFVGANGAGKSVLLKTVVGEIEPTEGEVWVGPSIKIGYLAQDQETLDPESTPARDGTALAPLLRGRSRIAPDEVPLSLRAGSTREQAALRRRADAAPASAPDARRPEPARPRRTDEPSRYRVGRGARSRARGVRRDRRRDLARPLLPRPDRRPDRRGRATARRERTTAATPTGSSGRPRAAARPASARSRAPH